MHRDTQIINAMRRWMGLNALNDFSHLGLNERCWKNKINVLNETETLNFLE